MCGGGHDGVASGDPVQQPRPDRARQFADIGQNFFRLFNGVFRFLPDGTNERALAVAQVRNGQAVVIDPAPRNFGGFGF